MLGARDLDRPRGRAWIRGEHVVVHRHQHVDAGGGGELDRLVLVEVAHDPHRLARRVAAVDRQQHDVGTQLAHRIGQAVVGNGVARVVNADVVRLEDVAEVAVAACASRAEEAVGVLRLVAVR